MTQYDWTTLLQSGRGEITHYVGLRPQRGAGIGSLIRRLIKMVPSFLSSPVGSTLMKTGKDIVQDMNQGTDLGTSVKKNARSAVKNLVGVGKRRRLRPQRGKGRSSPQKGKGRIIGYIKGKKRPPTRTLRRTFIK